VFQEPVTIHATRADPDAPGFPAVTVNPHDIIVADTDGVVVFPPKDVDEVVKLCRKGKEVDDRCMADIKNGRPIQETFKEHRGK
jgi:regulator of RNase E activity RraA